MPIPTMGALRPPMPPNLPPPCLVDGGGGAATVALGSAESAGPGGTDPVVLLTCRSSLVLPESGWEGQ